MTPRRLAAALLAMTVFGGLLAPAALADDTNVTVDSGNLEMDTIAVADFPNVTPSSTTQTIAAAMNPFNVRDFRGTGEGWHATAVATQFAEWNTTDGYVTGGETLPADSLTMPLPTVAAVNDTDPAQNPGTVDPGTIDTSDGSTSLIADTGLGGDGMGEFEFTIGDLSLDILPDTVANTQYRSDVTVDLVTGPSA